MRILLSLVLFFNVLFSEELFFSGSPAGWPSYFFVVDYDYLIGDSASSDCHVYQSGDYYTLANGSIAYKPTTHIFSLSTSSCLSDFYSYYFDKVTDECYSYIPYSVIRDYCIEPTFSNSDNYSYDHDRLGYVSNDDFNNVICIPGLIYDSNLHRCIEPKCPDLTPLIIDKCVRTDYAEYADCNELTGEINITCKTCDYIMNMQIALCNSLGKVLKDGSYNCSEYSDTTIKLLDYNVSEDNCIDISDSNDDDDLAETDVNDSTALDDLSDDTNDNTVDNNVTSLDDLVVPSTDTNISDLNTSVAASSDDLNTSLPTSSTNDKFVEKDVSDAAGKDEELPFFTADTSSIDSLKEQTSILSDLIEQYKTTVDNIKNDLGVVMNSYEEAKELFEKPIDFSMPVDSSDSPCISFEIFNRNYTLDPCPYLSIVAPMIQFILTIMISLFFIFSSIKALKE